MAADAASFAVSALCLLAIRTREPPAGLTARSQRLRAQLGVGTSYVLSDPILRKSVAWSGTANFFVIIVETLGPLFLVRGDHVNPALVGVLLALGATGGIAGGLLCQPLARRLGSARLTWLSVTAFTLPGLLIPLAGPGWSMLLFAAGWISWSFGSTLCGVALISYQQRTSPPQLRGQVAAAVRWINWGTLPLGGLTAGALGGVLGVHTMLWIAVVGGCSAGIWLYRSPLRFLRDMPHHRPSAHHNLSHSSTFPHLITCSGTSRRAASPSPYSTRGTAMDVTQQDRNSQMSCSLDDAARHRAAPGHSRSPC
jgi:MFS family permease